LKYKLIEENVFQTRLLYYIKKKQLAVEEEVLASQRTCKVTQYLESASFVEFFFLSKPKRSPENLTVSKK